MNRMIQNALQGWFKIKPAVIKIFLYKISNICFGPTNKMISYDSNNILSQKIN